MFKRNDDEENNDNDEDGKSSDNRFGQGYGDGIYLTMNGEKVNICDEEYIQIVSKLHQKLKDVLIAACSGSSSKERKKN